MDHSVSIIINTRSVFILTPHPLMTVMKYFCSFPDYIRDYSMHLHLLEICQYLIFLLNNIKTLSIKTPFYALLTLLVDTMYFNICFFFPFWPCHTACKISFPRPGIEFKPLPVEERSPNYWDCQGIPLCILILSCFLINTQ